MTNTNWPTALMASCGFFAAAWAIRSFLRIFVGEKP